VQAHARGRDIDRNIDSGRRLTEQTRSVEQQIRAVALKTSCCLD